MLTRFPVPPREFISEGYGGYQKIGRTFVGYFLDLYGLKPTDVVLDVGCGIGRMALPLTDHLRSGGRYEGFDIIPKAVEWCTKNISGEFPHFNFQHANVYNKRYNPGGKYKASGYVFPYNDRSFDFVFLTSVFTHMLPRDMERYLSEISRVLKAGGKCLITFFLINPRASELIAMKKSDFDFPYDLGECRAMSRDVPEQAISYKEPFIRDLFIKYGLSILKPIRYGFWCGRKVFLDYQDIIVAVRQGDQNVERK